VNDDRSRARQLARRPGRAQPNRPELGTDRSALGARLRPAAALIALAFGGSPAFAQEHAITFAPTAASTISNRVDAIFNFELALSVAITIGVCFTILFFCVKYRHGVKADRANPPTQNRVAEAIWIITPIVLSLGTAVWGARVYYDMYKAPPGSIRINVVAKQWMWKLQHPEGQREINELHIPVGRPVQLILTSQDVIHSFFVPAFRIKQDVLPGRTTTTWFQATKAGSYHLLCSQFCGMDHSHMTGTVYAMEPADYENWLNRTQGQPTMAAEGAKLYQRLGCSGCHGASNTVRAPSLDGIYGKPVPLEGRRIVIADDRYLHDSILLPKQEVAAGYKPVMPSFKGQIGEDEVLELVAYIRSLGDKHGREDPRLPEAGNSAEKAKEQQQSVHERTRQEKIESSGGGHP
jgi:cytochrome c oxidase subunit II